MTSCLPVCLAVILLWRKNISRENIRQCFIFSVAARSCSQSSYLLSFKPIDIFAKNQQLTFLTHPVCLCRCAVRIQWMSGWMNNERERDAMWWCGHSERQWFNGATMRCARDRTCLNYTQLVWANSRRVGCATKRCAPLLYSQVRADSRHYASSCAIPLCLQCFDAVGWVTGRASRL